MMPVTNLLLSSLSSASFAMLYAVGPQVSKQKNLPISQGNTLGVMVSSKCD